MSLSADPCRVTRRVMLMAPPPYLYPQLAAKTTGLTSRPPQSKFTTSPPNSPNGLTSPYGATWLYIGAGISKFEKWTWNGSNFVEQLPNQNEAFFIGNSNLTSVLKNILILARVTVVLVVRWSIIHYRAKRRWWCLINVIKDSPTLSSTFCSLQPMIQSNIGPIFCFSITLLF